MVLFFRPLCLPLSPPPYDFNLHTYIKYPLVCFLFAPQPPCAGCKRLHVRAARARVLNIKHAPDSRIFIRGGTAYTHMFYFPGVYYVQICKYLYLYTSNNISNVWLGVLFVNTSPPPEYSSMGIPWSSALIVLSSTRKKKHQISEPCALCV